MTNEREDEFNAWYIKQDESIRDYDVMRMAYQAATAASDARYQARIKELEEALAPFAENIPEDYKAPCHSGITTARKCGRCGKAHRAHKTISTTIPDTALQRALLEARIDASLQAFNLVPYNQQLSDGIVWLRTQLAALGE